MTRVDSGCHSCHISENSHRLIFRLLPSVGVGETHCILSYGKVLCSLAAGVTFLDSGDLPKRLRGPLDIYGNCSDMLRIGSLERCGRILADDELLFARSVPAGDLGKRDSVFSDDEILNDSVARIAPFTVQTPARFFRPFDRDLDRTFMLFVVSGDGRRSVFRHGHRLIGRRIPVGNIRERNRMLADHDFVDRLSALVASLAVQAPARFRRTVDRHRHGAEMPRIPWLSFRKRILRHGDPHLTGSIPTVNLREGKPIRSDNKIFDSFAARVTPFAVHAPPRFFRTEEYHLHGSLVLNEFTFELCNGVLRDFDSLFRRFVPIGKIQERH